MKIPFTKNDLFEVMIWKIPEPKSQKENDWFSLPNSSLESGSLSYLHFLRRRNWWRLSSYKARESDVVVVVALPVVQVCHSLCQARRELSETLPFFLQEVSSGGMFRRKIHPRKKTKNTKKHGTWKFLLEKEKTSQSTQSLGSML